MYCEKAERNNKGGWDYEVKPYKPADYLLQDLAVILASSNATWTNYVNDGLNRLKGVPGRWEPPEEATDRLCVDVGGGAFIEVSHPAPQGEKIAHPGKYNNRVDFCCKVVALPWMDSVRKGSAAMLSSGISDYRDGTRGKEWQPNAALAAAAVMKAIILALEPPTD
ncbi:jg15450 [Pararge aegeria aegeria]|uniref:Jg15450 protein n=1 Tax=Pararge aegeria aegeria TaxID=348720 RepID=A0A8S4S430_9NEOP|nr:jg15450 [Pararge aegeria aegeria]